MKIENYETLSEAMNDLIEQGYDTDFSILADKECLKCHKTSLHLSPNQFEIEHWYHFDEMSDPGSDVTLFVISSKNKKVKGLVTLAHGVYADSVSTSIIDKLKTHLKK